MWTSYRDPEGRLVIELPNSVPAAGVADLYPDAGLVSAVRVEQPSRDGGPLTRLVVATRQEVEHSVSGEGRNLEIELSPTGDVVAAATAGASDDAIAYEPLPSDGIRRESADVAGEMAEAGEPAAAPLETSPPETSAPVETTLAEARAAAAGAAPSYAPSYPTDAGTADDPFVAPPPTGEPASRVGRLAVERTPHGTVVRVVGDGQFDYSTFALDNPHRFVIDLAGVANEVTSPSMPVGGVVQRIRVGQFRSQPQPVSRVVFDLDAPIIPRIERTDDALVVSFGELNGNSPLHHRAAASTAVPAVERYAEPVPSSSRAASPMAPPPSRAMPAAMGDQAPDPAPGAMPSMDSSPMDSSPMGTAPTDSMAMDPSPMDPEPDAAAQVDEVEIEPEGTEVTITNEPENPEQQQVEVQMQPEREPTVVAEPAMREAEPRRTPPPASPPAMQSTSDLYQPASVEITTPEPPVDTFAARTVGGGDREFVGERLDFSLRDADLVETLRSFAVMSGLNIVIQPGVQGTVTVELQDVPWDQAFEQILKINNLAYEVEGNIMRIAPIATLQKEAQERRQLEASKALAIPLTTVIRRVSYSNAASVAQVLKSGGILSQRGTVIVDPRTNTLIIKELPDYIDTVIAVIENLDIPEPLVMIEARIVETRKNFTRTLGIQWGFEGVSAPQYGNTTGLVFPNQGTASGGVNLLAGGDNGLIDITLGNVLNTFNLDAQLQAAENEGLINILSAPKVQALNNEQASIQSGVQIPIQTVANNTVSVQFVNATPRLDVTPQVTAEGTVLMDINIQKRNPEFGLTVAGATNAPISTKEARTRVIVRDGGTTVIGGIYEVTTNQGEDRVPGLANVPIIGHLFKNRRRSDENSELLIFITPRVVKL
jgi:type IV pilus assembly protein PilQ